MRKFFLLSSAAALSMFAVGCVSAEDLCESSVQTTCERVHTCSSATEKGSDTFKASFGANASECETKLIAASKCSELKENDELCTGTNAGKKFDLGAAADCSDGIKKLSCEDYNARRLPAVCSQTCK